MPRPTLVALAVVAALAAGACGGGSSDNPAIESGPTTSAAAGPTTTVAAAAPATTAGAGFTLTSSAFADGATIPRTFTCDGAGTPPPLSWSGVPAGTKALALVVDDPDAPGATFVHWVVFDLSPTATTIGTQAPMGRTSAGSAAYTGPCPPKGDPPHHYVFRLTALRAPLGLPTGSAAADVERAISREALAEARLTGRYGR